MQLKSRCEDLNRHFFQRKYTNGQKAHKPCSTNYQRSADENCNEVAPHTSQNGNHQKVYRQ